MRTNVESIQPERKFEGKRIFPIFGALVAALMLATPAPAQTNAVADALWASVDQLVQAAVAAGGGDSTTALSALGTAEDLLSQAKAALASSGLSLDPVKFGKKIDGANKKLVGLQSYLEGSKWSEKSAVSKLASAAKSLQKLANLAGQPLLVEVNAKTAGFHKAGTVVPMAFAIPEGCTDWEITCRETVLGSGVVASFPTNPAPGGFSVTLGSTRGSARVTVTGCGLPPGGKGWLLYNYGAKPAKTGGGGGGCNAWYMTCGSIQNGIEVTGWLVPYPSCNCPTGTHEDGIDSISAGGPWRICSCD